ncbi:MAG: ribosome biogenesis GTPase Der [Anaerolineae bacterium]|nr:ribosome biogenesis GTPase Der [Anaerolineae bacterium]
MSRRPLVALVGRPNVGKSTLFNRIVGRRMAVVSEVAGTTRDRLYAESEWNGINFMLVDTGGIELLEGWHTEPLSEDSEKFLPLIRRQAEVAIQDADVIVHVVDGQVGITAADREVGKILHRANKPVIIAANKLESSKLHDTAYEFYELGLGEVIAVSSLHGTGTGDLLDAVADLLPSFSVEDVEDETIKVAILGRPNVGKSTLVNKLVGEDRVIVSPIAGTTRDAIDTKVRAFGEEFTLIDTAGIRRRGKIDPGVEKYSVLRAMKALDRADVALLLLNAEEGIIAQDLHVGGMLQEEQSAGVILLINKWDVVEKDTHSMHEFTNQVREAFNFLPYAPLLFISAETGQRVSKILPLVLEVHAARHHRVVTADLNRWLRETLEAHPPPHRSGLQLKFYYMTQVGVAPPTFVFFVNRPEWVHFGYQRYLENRLRETFPFVGTPIKLLFRGRESE